ncbi:hypothetical protein DPMN_028104 [Dreissena polymorpha]|uniref:Uncharacterized protein n=1 Tax=Dreissena polymorpha TaxID=45954 RepID=A0A9D4RE26_DREPO|nr:hypothetical protein DPMN_028104 [Dreissena polymorpha]
MLPYHSRQIGSLYFSTPRKVKIFGIRIDAIPKQVNFHLDEHDTIGQDGSLSGGPNAVLSMIDWALYTYSGEHRECAFHADNCPDKLV